MNYFTDCSPRICQQGLTRGVTKYALTSALQDRRFTPIQAAELTRLRVKVSLLVQYEPCTTVHDWIVGVHGIMIEWTEDIVSDANATPVGFDASNADSSTRKYSATYLPEVAAEQGWDQTAAIDSLIRKAGYQAKITPTLLARITCTRYQSSKYALEFANYCALRQAQLAQAQQQNVANPNSSALQAYQIAVAAANGGSQGNANCRVM